MVTQAGELLELVESGFHKEYPEVFVECALHNLRKVCLPDLDSLKSLYSPKSKSLDPFQDATSLLSQHRSAFLKVFQWLNRVQANTQSLQKLIAEQFAISPFSDFKISVIGSLFTPDIFKVLKPYLYAYLLLELTSAEDEVPREENCFEASAATAQLAADGPISSLVESCRELFSPTAPFSFRFLLEDLIAPFAESAFLCKTRELIEGCYTKFFLEPLKAYEERVMKAIWLPRVLESMSSCIPWNTQLVYVTFYGVRKSELFCIMMDYPESHPAVMDLKAYLMETRSLQSLIDSMSKEVNSKLLQPGVHTDEVLLAYGCLVRGLREIDPSSVAQDIICSPVASCLRERDDAVRCIVDRLIDPSPDEERGGLSDQLTGLQRELLLPTPLEVEPTDEARDCDAHLVFHGRPSYWFCSLSALLVNTAVTSSVPDPDECFPAEVVAAKSSEGENPDSERGIPEELCPVNADWDRWMPDPLEALHHTAGPPWKRRIDLLSLLVGGIYGSKRSFLTEYRALLSQRLLKQLDFETSSAMRHLELLKMRFGDLDMQECEVGCFRCFSKSFSICQSDSDNIVFYCLRFTFQSTSSMIFWLMPRVVLNGLFVNLISALVDIRLFSGSLCLAIFTEGSFVEQLSRSDSRLF